MNRRNFLQLAMMASAAEGAKRVWPFRMYSFPSAARKTLPFTHSGPFLLDDLLIPFYSPSSGAEIVDVYSADRGTYRATWCRDASGIYVPVQRDQWIREHWPQREPGV